MTKHDRVERLVSYGNGLYNLSRKDGDTLRVFICECYAFGVAEYMETVERLGRLDAIIINSAWCDYSFEAKLHCREECVGLFKIKDFMAALNMRKYWLYLNKDEKEYLRKTG
jgi:hypothetical protein